MQFGSTPPLFVSGDLSSQANDNIPYKQYRLRGIFRTKAGELDATAFFYDDEIRQVQNNPSNNVNIIAVSLYSPDDAIPVRDDLVEQFGSFGTVETLDELIGVFLNDIRTIFSLLGSIVGGIGLIVASITIFIIIFVTASSRRRFIGILKGIGLTQGAIIASYVLYALFFAIAGTAIGIALLKFVLIPYFIANPVPFPFSDGVLYITKEGVINRVILLVGITLLAGFFPRLAYC